jgi:hypothetical protein
VGYLVACYVLVVGTVLVYGLRIQAQRRALMRQAKQPPEPDQPPR